MLHLMNLSLTLLSSANKKEADGKDSIDELPEEIFSTFEVTGYTIGGSDDNIGITLVGKRFLKK